MNAEILSVIKMKLQNLRNSCYEGLDGTWDCSTDEGKESFEPMAESCEEIATLLGIQLEDYEPIDDESDDEDNG